MAWSVMNELDLIGGRHWAAYGGSLSGGRSHRRGYRDTGVPGVLGVPGSGVGGFRKPGVGKG